MLSCWSSVFCTCWVSCRSDEDTRRWLPLLDGGTFSLRGWRPYGRRVLGLHRGYKLRACGPAGDVAGRGGTLPDATPAPGTGGRSLDVLKAGRRQDAGAAKADLRGGVEPVPRLNLASEEIGDAAAVRLEVSKRERRQQLVRCPVVIKFNPRGVAGGFKPQYLLRPEQ